jgi:NTE family protein
MKTKVQLVLGSGGARGIAHIGVIEGLLQDGYEIVEIAGCSMGAVVGGMFCAGQLFAYRDWLVKQTKSDVYGLFDMAFSKQGLVKGERIFGVLRQMAGDHLIEHLPIPFMAIGTDILSSTEVLFTSGDLYKALRASTGIPGAFTPITEGNRLFVDGGVLNPLPVNHIKRRKDAIVVAVNLYGDPSPVVQESSNAVETDSGSSAMLARLRKYFYPAAKTEVKSEPVAELPVFSMFELLDLSLDLTLDRLVEANLKLCPADLVVEIPRNSCSVFEFYRASELIDIGREAYVKARDRQVPLPH